MGTSEPETAEQRRILDRLNELLDRVYPRKANGKYDWYSWQSEYVAQFIALHLVRYPEWWPSQIDLATESVHALRVVQLLVETLYDKNSMDLIIAPNQGPPGEDGLEWSPLFVWMVGFATGNRTHPKSKKGPDPAALVWRDIAIWNALDSLGDLGLDPKLAFQLVAGRVGLNHHSIRRIWGWGLDTMQSLRGKPRPTFFLLGE